MTPYDFKKKWVKSDGRKCCVCFYHIEVEVQTFAQIYAVLCFGNIPARLQRARHRFTLWVSCDALLSLDPVDLHVRILSILLFLLVLLVGSVLYHYEIIAFYKVIFKKTVQEYNLKGLCEVLEKKFQTQTLIFTTWKRRQYKLRNIYLFHEWINKLFSEENKVYRTLCEAREVAGSAKCKTNSRLSFKIS